MASRVKTPLIRASTAESVFLGWGKWVVCSQRFEIPTQCYNRSKGISARPESPTPVIETECERQPLIAPVSEQSTTPAAGKTSACRYHEPRGSLPAPVAQVVEQAPFKRLVVGSSPTGRTERSPDLRSCCAYSRVVRDVVGRAWFTGIYPLTPPERPTWPVPRTCLLCILSTHNPEQSAVGSVAAGSPSASMVLPKAMPSTPAYSPSSRPPPRPPRSQPAERIPRS